MIRTDEQLDYALTGELAWRRKELEQLELLVKGSQSIARAMYIRAGVAMLYAHWEGFVRKSAELYVEFVECQRANVHDLAANFVALSSIFRGKLASIDESDKIRFRIALIEEIRNPEYTRARFSRGSAPSTRSNLSSEVLKEIVTALALDYAPYMLKENLIDERLVRARNEIAHGNFLTINETDYLDLSRSVSALLSMFRDQVSNAAVLKQYLRKVASVAR
jgi:hypothetical protein